MAVKTPNDGRLTDNKGRVVNFKNTIIIMTSNIGSHIIQENFEGLERKNLEEVIEKTQREVMDLLRKTVRPEFLNRVDELIMFRPLSQGDVREIVKLQLHQLLAKLEEKGYQLIPSEELIEHIGSAGFDPQFGARPIAHDPEGTAERAEQADHRGHARDRQAAGDRRVRWEDRVEEADR